MGLGTESINAITFHTAAMAPSVSFYEAMGFSLVFGGPDSSFTSLAGLPGPDGPTHFVNLQLLAGFALDAIWGRVIFHTPSLDDVDRLHEALQAHGYEPEMAPSDAPWGERYFHIRDPNGHELSIACRLDRA